MPSSIGTRKVFQSHRHQVVLADRKNDIHQLLRVVPSVELGPSPVADVGVAMQLIHRPQQGAVETRPSPIRRSPRHPHNLLIAEAGLAGHEAVLAPLVLRAAQVADAEDQQLAITGRQGAVAKDVTGESSPRAGERRMVGDRLCDVDPFRRLEGRDPRLCRLRPLTGQGKARDDQTQRHPSYR